MQANKITIGADIYDRFKETPDKTTYVAPDHSISHTNIMLLGRTVATSESANAKIRVNFVRDIDKGDTAGTKGRVYANIECSYPQWATSTQLQAITATVNAFLSSTEFDELLRKQSI